MQPRSTGDVLHMNVTDRAAGRPCSPSGSAEPGKGDRSAHTHSSTLTSCVLKKKTKQLTFFSSQSSYFVLQLILQRHGRWASTLAP